jgi:hypothetical protein
MGKAEAGSAKAIANAIKAKGTCIPLPMYQPGAKLGAAASLQPILATLHPQIPLTTQTCRCRIVYTLHVHALTV